MKRTILMMLAAVFLITTAAVQTGGDIANRVDGVVADAGTYNGTADTGTAVALSGYNGAALVVAGTVVDNVAGTLGYVVIQDSTSIASWTARDSVAVDSVNNKYYDLHYRRTGAGAVKLRPITRGGVAAAADSLNRTIIVLRACQRLPC